MIFYHGSKDRRVVETITPDCFGPDGELLCASASINVARRYTHNDEVGGVITRFRLNPEANVCRATIRDWWFNKQEAKIDLNFLGYVHSEVGSLAANRF